MQLQINKKVIKQVTLSDKAKGTTVATFRFARDAGGLRVFCKSPTLETYFKRISRNRMTDEWYGQIGYHTPTLSNRDMSRSFDNWGIDQLFISEQCPNLAWMKIQGLGKGINFTFESIPIHTDEYSKYMEITMKMVERVYNDYIRPKSTTGKITTKLTGDFA